MSEEQVRVIDVQGQSVIGVLHRSSGISSLGVVVVVGGPQYRIGSHRQFVLMGRALSAAGHDALRFDCRGMGDSGGALRTFESIDEDIRAAVDELCRARPSIKHVVLLGLCDGATAALMYANNDARVRSVIMLNPWVRSDATFARTTIVNYYFRRLLSTDFWRKLFTGGVRLREAADDVARASRAAASTSSDPGFLKRLDYALRAFKGSIQVILSGNDLTAAEFRLWIVSDRRRQRSIGRAGNRVLQIADANHTFSSAISRACLFREVLDYCSERQSAI